MTEVLGLKVQNDRCQARWRGGDGWNVALTKETWYDHRTEKGGGLLQLCAEAMFGGNIHQAQEKLGEWLGLTVRQKTVKLENNGTRYEQLVADGYKESKRYDYRDLEGNIVHTVIRMEHKTKSKEFIQRTPDHPGLGDTKTILYNLKGWVASPWVAIVEGEKDADTLIALGMPATTNAGGAEKWRNEFDELFRGKQVAVLRDNDEAGDNHARLICRHLVGIAAEVRVLCLSKLPKGDVTDWMQKEGGNPAQLLKEIGETHPVVNVPDVDDDKWALESAKKSNQRPLSNATFEQKKIDGEMINVDVPRLIGEIVDDCHRRFLGFPRKIGDSQLFDHDRDSKRIEYISKTPTLFAWMAMKSKQPVMWSKVSGAITKEELYEGLISNAIRYESISFSPDWPKRSDVYYAHERLPEPHPEHQYFGGLIDFFTLADEGYRPILMAMFAAPLYYKDSVPRPCWIVDSVDGAGCGKTTIVELLAMLFSGNPVRTSKQELKMDCKELIKRLVSAEGRNAKVLLVDNVTGRFDLPEFADLVTARSISGKAPYGRGEETRPNNLTYVITSNSATVGDDIAIRSYYLMVKRPTASATWKERVLDYIRNNRLRIFADIIDILSNHKPIEGVRPVSRFPEFEVQILQAMCKDLDEYDTACTKIIGDRSESNIDEDRGRQAEDMLRNNISEMTHAGSPINPATSRVFVYSEVLTKWVIESFDDECGRQDLYDMARAGVINHVNKKIRRFPEHGESRRRGLLWEGEESKNDDDVIVIGMGRNKKGTVVGVKKNRVGQMEKVGEDEKI